MTIPQKLLDFTELLGQSLLDNTFITITLSGYQGAEDQLKNIYVKKSLIKNTEMLSFTYRYKTRDQVKNFILGEGVATVQQLLQKDFRNATLFTTAFDLIFEQLNQEKAILKKKPATKTETPPLAHDRPKNRLIEAAPEKAYLHALNITDANGRVLQHAQDKYRQINRYVEILSPLIKDIPPGQLRKVVDMGSGKGYLTFALYDYLTNVLKQPCEVVGVEFRKGLVDLCNGIAREARFENLHFAQGSIEDFDGSDTSILIALHACDTATDDAIHKGIATGAELIVVAPCCHKQIRREMEKNKPLNDLGFLTKHGIFLERQAEMVTDGIRAMMLEYCGYKTKVFEFISDAHTPKNVMIVGAKSPKSDVEKAEILEKINAAKTYFGIGYHHLERKVLG